jgi:protein-disulfide isomerase
MKIYRLPLFLSLVLVSLSYSISRADDATKAGAPVAKIGNTILTEDDLRKEMGMSLYDAENQLYQVKKNWVDQKAKNILFDQAAKDAGLSRAAWQAKEIDAKSTPPTQQEIDQLAPRFAAQGSSATISDEQLAKYKEQAKQYLTNQKKAMAENTVYQQLLQKNPVELLFVKPEAPHIDVTSPKDSPVKGSANASVTVVEFTDFQCPWCKRSQDTVKAVEQAYGTQIKLVDRMFPLTQMHPRAMPSAEAAFCAKEQGKYWEMRDKLFASQTMSDDDFKQFAKDLGLKEKKFGQCLADHKYDTAIQADMADGQRYGVRGTPTFFVNGMQTNFTQLQDAVKNELAKQKS